MELVWNAKKFFIIIICYRKNVLYATVPVISIGHVPFSAQGCSFSLCSSFPPLFQVEQRCTERSFCTVLTVEAPPRVGSGCDIGLYECNLNQLLYCIFWWPRIDFHCLIHILNYVLDSWQCHLPNYYFGTGRKLSHWLPHYRPEFPFTGKMQGIKCEFVQQNQWRHTYILSPWLCMQFIQRFINSSWYARYEELPPAQTATIIWSLIVSMFAVGGLCGALSARVVSCKLGRWDENN